TQDLKREQIKESQTGYMPTLNLTASRSVKNSHDRGNEYSNTYSGSNSVDLSLSLPLFNGGATYSQVEQAKYNFVGASQDLENTYRKVIQEVHSSSNNI
ncbi:TolC family protein, partial [Xenorhabdus bovienii]|uniref:TolC family protein n=1 Tax=Xenorhabdus bovienii TaxID=40576 RepID=UPI0023B32188